MGNLLQTVMIKQTLYRTGNKIGEEIKVTELLIITTWARYELDKGITRKNKNIINETTIVQQQNNMYKLSIPEHNLLKEMWSTHSVSLGGEIN